MKGITKTKGVCGGAACIENTRIPVWMIVEYWTNLSVKNDTLLQIFPTITRGQLELVHLYYSANREEVDREVRENATELGDGT